MRTRPITVMSKRSVALLLAATSNVAATACSEPASAPDGGATTVVSVLVTPSALNLAVGRTGQLSAQALNGEGSALAGRAVVWSAGDTLVARVSAGGLVFALAAGTSSVTATVEGKSDTAVVTVSAATSALFTLSSELLGTARSLSAWVQGVNPATGQVLVNGSDMRAPSVPFTFDWGDGSTTNGFLVASHTYADASRNYLVRVTAHYAAGATDTFSINVRFTAPRILRLAHPAGFAVTIPAQVPALQSRQPGYGAPAGLLAFDDSYFGATLPRADAEYVLSQAAAVEAAVLENDVEPVDGAFRQAVLRDPNTGGAYSLWFTTPVAFGAAGAYVQGTPGWSSLLHEMGHNFSLNAPGAFRYGGRIDGDANAIFSEAVAQMFQHAAAYELVNNAARYGLPDDIALDIANSARASAQIVRSAYDAYVVGGKLFTTWNDPATPADETFGTFMTVAREFMVHAEQAGSYLGPLARAMRLLRTFNQSLLTQYAPQTDSPAASTFRATLMVAALSYGFQQDLRAEFRALGFPVDDGEYASLYASVP